MSPDQDNKHLGFLDAADFVEEMANEFFCSRTADPTEYMREIARRLRAKAGYGKP